MSELCMNMLMLWKLQLKGEPDHVNYTYLCKETPQVWTLASLNVQGDVFRHVLRTEMDIQQDMDIWYLVLSFT